MRCPGWLYYQYQASSEEELTMDFSINLLAESSSSGRKNARNRQFKCAHDTMKPLKQYGAY